MGIPALGLILVVACVPGCSSDSDGGVTGPRTIEVGPGAGADYASIQEAIDAAPAGSTILVQAGSYIEAVAVSKSLTLTGAGPSTVVEYPAGGPADAAVIVVRDAGGVRIEDLRVSSSDPDVDGIRVRDSASVVLDSIVASGHSQDGIDVRRSSDVEIVSGTAEMNAGDGIQIDEDCTGVTIRSSRSAANGTDGIKVVQSTDVVVEDSTFTQNGDDGILVRDSAEVRLVGNASTDNLGWGISVNDSTDVLLDGNTLTGNQAGDFKCDPGPC
jgi:parallel beta-helix repeat protein